MDEMNKMVSTVNQESHKAQSLEEKLKFKEQEVDLLYEELVKLRTESDASKSEVANKQQEMGNIF